MQRFLKIATRPAVVMAGGFLVSGLLALAAQEYAARNAIAVVRAEARQTLDLQLEVLSGQLEKYRLLPPLLARRSDVRSLYFAGSEEFIRRTARSKAMEIAGLSGAMDVAFADADARVFASSRGIFEKGDPTPASAYEAARQGRLGRASIPAPVSERAYVFTAAIRTGPEVEGFVSVYVGFDQIEATWSLARPPIAVTAGDGRVFLSNRPIWIGRSMSGTGNAILDANPLQAPGGLVRVADLAGRNHVALWRDLPLLGWRFYTFADQQPVITARRQAALVAGLSGLLASAALWLLMMRAEAARSRMRRDKALSLRLERQVRDRTAKLTEANTQLALEVDERRQAEERLRRTQDELVQAAKLAAIGQMSTALSHEYNQPLAAISTHADNATQFLDRGDTENVRQSLSAISAMVGRISALSRSLLSFARKPGTRIVPVDVDPVLDETFMLAGPRAKKAGVLLTRSGDRGARIMGGKVRLTQIIVNLVNNAIDAAAAGPREPHVAVTVSRGAGGIVIAVDDSGNGVAQENRQSVFEPFFTTKEVGSGLGIGLSIVYSMTKDLGGTVAVDDSELGGARFTVTLVNADQTVEPAKEAAGALR